MKLVLLDRDGVIVINRATNIKSPSQLAFIDGTARAIATLNEAGFTVAICTNQPEVGRGAMGEAQLQRVHAALVDSLGQQGAVVDRIFSCTSLRKCPRRKPACGMLQDAVSHYGAEASATPFVGDQSDDLKAAFHAGCRRVLVKTGLGSKALARGLPDYVRPFAVCDDLLAAAQGIVRGGI